MWPPLAALVASLVAAPAAPAAALPAASTSPILATGIAATSPVSASPARPEFESEPEYASEPGSGSEPARRPVVSERTDTATVVLLHGLGRSQWSMRRMAGRLREAGYRVFNLGYPSTDHTIGTLADTMAAELRRCCADADTLHFVTHSLGGILVRVWEARTEPDNLGRVVMLSPPNQGSDVADRIPDRLLRLVMGPASVQLGTDSTDLPVRLPPVDFELGIIAGDASLNPLYSWWIPGEDDGMVAVESMWVEGTDDFLIVPYTHTFIMYRGRVIEEVLSFLRTGRFTEAVGS